MFEPLCLSILAEIAAYRGETERARREIPALLQVVERARFRMAAFRLRIALAVLELSYDDAGASWRQVAHLFHDVDELDGYLVQLAGSAAIEALLATGDLRQAEWLLAQIDQRAANGDTALRPLVLRCRGLLLAAHGDHERATASLEGGALVPEPSQGVNPFELARTLLALGTVQRRAQHKRVAREALEQAVGIFERLGARVWSEKARSELRRIGGRTTSDGELSETERKIVELVVAGRRNREVAAELSLSPNTVSWNLSKIYRKLGVSSRTELAARMRATKPKRDTFVRLMPHRAGAGSWSQMPTYLVERYLPARDRAWLESALARLARGRNGVTYLGARPTFHPTSPASASSRRRRSTRSEMPTRLPGCRSRASSPPKRSASRRGVRSGKETQHEVILG